MATYGRKCIDLLQASLNSIKNTHVKHSLCIRHELNQVRGLIPLLMKHRNGEKWDTEERTLLLSHLRTLSGLSPYLIPILLPGGFFLLPLVAYWMDHRRNARKDRESHGQI
jgi:hypothetical protein